MVIDQESGFEVELDNEYMMSPKDLCTLDFLDQVIDAGTKVLKIEGRGRAPEYVAKVIKTYREAIDAYYAETYSKEKVDTWMEELKKVYNRGFWSGYYLGQKLGSLGFSLFPWYLLDVRRGCFIQRKSIFFQLSLNLTIN